MAILKDKTAIVTGAGGGIGKVVAGAMLQEGAKVVLADYSRERLELVSAELSPPDRVLAVPVDVADARQVEKLAAEARNKFGDIDILVNAAGIQQPIGPFIEADLETWIKNINVNLIGTVSCCKAVLPDMVKCKRGKIINFSGGGATGPRPNFSAYACAKTAIVRFTEILALEVAPYGIDVNAIAPGAVATSMIEEIMKAGDRAGNKELVTANKIMKEGGTDPHLPAKLIVYLASDKSDGLTGRLISAVWDEWNDFGGRIKQITDSSLYTLRRIDGRNFTEAAAK